MYRVLKEAGYGANVILENTDTKASVIIGRINMEILRLIEKDRGGDIDRTSKWLIEITKETAIELQKMTINMKKPIRSQKAKDLFKKPNKEIDAMDVLLGLANYSKKGDE